MSPSELTMSAHDGAEVKERRSQPHLVLALRCDQLLAAPERIALGALETITFGRGTEARDQGTPGHLEIRLDDSFVSTTHARMTKSVGRWAIDDAGSKNGTRVNGVLTPRRVLEDGDTIELGHTFIVFRQSVTEAESAPSGPLTTVIPELARAYRALARVAVSTVSVALRGEVGTGKEVAARAVHQLSGRRGPFIAVNCGAIPANLVETELFGHRKGAFSGATEDRIGIIRSAHEGTLFLDEVSELPQLSQVALLRVLQEREVVPVGAARGVAVDLRLISAANRELETMVDRGEMRADLFSRINGFTMRLPPLRDRLEDLGLIIAGLLPRLATSPEQVGMQPSAARCLFRHPWPQNIRELEKALGAAIVLAAGKAVGVEHLPESMREPVSGAHHAVSPAGGAVASAPARRIDDERARIVDALERAANNQSRAADLLGISRRTLIIKMEKYRLPRPRKGPAGDGP